MLLLLLLLDLHMATLQVNEPLNNRTNVCFAYLSTVGAPCPPSLVLGWLVVQMVKVCGWRESSGIDKNHKQASATQVVVHLRL